MKITTWEDFNIGSLLQNSRPGSEEHKFFVWYLPLPEFDESLPGCCLNIRVSSLRQSDEDKVSLPDQLRMCWIKAMEDGYQVRAVYCDVQTGADANRRGFMQLIKDGKQKNRSWDVIYTLVWDRIVRGMDPAAALDKLIKKFDVDLRGVQQVIDVNQLGLWAWFGGMEKENIARRTKSGRNGNAENGFLPSGNPPFGHTVAPANNGKKVVIIHEAESDAIRWAVDAYLDGTPRRQICEYFNSRQLFRTDGVAWTPHMLHGLFRQTSLKGDWKWGNHHIPVPPIISEELWELLQIKIEANKKSHSNVKKNHSLSGLLYCKVCGAHLYFKHKDWSYSYRTNQAGERVRYRYDRQTYYGYVCDSYDKGTKRDCRKQPTVAEKWLLAQVWPFTVELVRSPDNALAILDEYIKANQLDGVDVQSALADINARLAALDDEQKIYARQVARKQITEKMFDELVGELDEQRYSANTEKERILVTENNVREMSQVREDLIVWFQHLGNIPLEEITQRDMQVEIIKSVFARIYLGSNNELEYRMRIPARLGEDEEEEGEGPKRYQSKTHSSRRLERYTKLQQTFEDGDDESGLTLRRVS